MTGKGRAGNGSLDFTIARLGDCGIVSPMSGVRFIHDQDGVLYPSTLADLRRLFTEVFEQATSDVGPGMFETTSAWAGRWDASCNLPGRVTP